jgi:hypothetical protein
MMRRLKAAAWPCTLVAIGLLASSIEGCTSASTSSTPSPDGVSPPVRVQVTVITLTFLIEDVDLANRQMTLRGSQGKTGVYIVSDAVEGLSEVKPGDFLVIESRFNVFIDAKGPPAQDGLEAVILSPRVELGADALSSYAPVRREVHASVTVCRVDREARTLSVKGSGDRVVRLRVDDASLFDSVEEGRTVVLTLVDELIVSIKRGTPPPLTK